MIYFPNAKINLGLNVIRKRADGYHDLDTVMYPIGLSDLLEVLPAPEFTFVQTGIPVDGRPDDNLCVKAYRLLAQQHTLPTVYMQLHKIIPTGAGLGGGSADAAVVLKALNSEFGLKLTNKQLEHYAAQLGSDCAFFINNTPAMATGRGEILSPVGLSLKGLHLLLVKPPFGIGTAQAYAGIVPHEPAKSLSEVIKQPIESWKTDLVNDFEPGIFAQHPALAAIKQQLYDMGAVYAAMSGSGSALFGLFKTEPAQAHCSFGDYFVYTQMIDV